MKKLIAIIVILLTNIVIFSACAGNHNSHAYTWAKTQEGHYKAYNCDCPTSDTFEAHYDNDADRLCDVCKFPLPEDFTSGNQDSSTDSSVDSSTPDSSPDDSLTDSSVDSSTPDSSPDDSLTDSSVDSSTPDSSPDDSLTDSSVDSSTPDSSPDDSLTDSSVDSSTPDSSPDDSSTDSSVDSSTPDSSPDDSSTDSSVDSSTPDSSPDDSSTDSSVESSTPDSSPDDSSTDSSGSYNPDDSSSEQNPDQPADNPNVDTHEHSYTTKVTAPTCTEEGYTTYTCSCGYSYTADQTAAKGHTAQTIAGKNATCTETGLTEGSKCSTCGTILTAQTEIPTIDHSYQSTVTAPTCTEKGYTTYTCSCGYSYTADQTAAKGHTETIIVGKAATCTETGLTNGAKCSVCGTITVTQTEIPATGHSWTPATTSAPKTCTTCGTTEGEKLPSDSGSSSGSGNTSTTTTYPTLTVNYINVGQGDSILIKVEDCDILIDAGKSSYGSTVTSYLKNKGVDDIELLINTHPDNDHYGGLPTVLSAYTIEKAWISAYNKTTSTYTSFKSALASECSYSTPSVGTVYSYGYLTLTVLYSSVGSDSNNSSIVVMLEYGNFRFLFTGDNGEEVENKLLNKDISCDVLKVGHHGSKYSSTSAFLSATGAKYGVICVGSNSYGHPTSEALGRLSSAGITVYRTDQNGNVVFSTNGATLTTPSGSSISSGSGSGMDSGSSGSGSTGSGSGSSGSTAVSSYVGNSSSKVFHYAGCSSAPTTNAVDLSSYTYSQIISLGYTPCSKCIGGSSTSYTYVINTSSKKIHEVGCSSAPTTNAEYVNGTLSYYVNTLGYSPCSKCIGSSSSTTVYILNSNTGVFHLQSCSRKPTGSNAISYTYAYSTMISKGYKPCSYCLG